MIKVTLTALSLLFLTNSLFINPAFAQDKVVGRVYEIKSKVSLAGIKIEDLKTHTISVSDELGRFSITASIGDFVSFSGFAYQADTLYIANLKYTEVFLTPKQNMLNEVKVTNSQLKTGKLAAAPITGVLGSRTVLYQVDGAGNDVGGVKLKVLDPFGGKSKRDKDNKISETDRKEQAIYDVFQAKNLQKYLPIKGTEMDNFIILYTPDIATYYDPGFNLVSYLNTSYQKFLEMPEADRKSETAFRLTLKSDSTKN